MLDPNLIARIMRNVLAVQVGQVTEASADDDAEIAIDSRIYVKLGQHHANVFSWNADRTAIRHHGGFSAETEQQVARLIAGRVNEVQAEHRASA